MQRAKNAIRSDTLGRPSTWEFSPRLPERICLRLQQRIEELYGGAERAEKNRFQHLACSAILLFCDAFEVLEIHLNAKREGDSKSRKRQRRENRKDIKATAKTIQMNKETQRNKPLCGEKTALLSRGNFLVRPLVSFLCFCACLVLLVSFFSSILRNSAFSFLVLFLSLFFAFICFALLHVTFFSLVCLSLFFNDQGGVLKFSHSRWRCSGLINTDQVRFVFFLLFMHQ